MKKIALLLLLLPNLLFSQIRKIERLGFQSDSEMFTDGKILYTDAITIQFRETVLDLPEGLRETLLDAIPSFAGIKNPYCRK